MEQLESRLRGRGTEKEESILKRLAGAGKEIEYSKVEGNFDKVFVNDDLKTTENDLANALKDWYPHLKEA